MSFISPDVYQHVRFIRLFCRWHFWTKRVLPPRACFLCTTVGRRIHHSLVTDHDMFVFLLPERLTCAADLWNKLQTERDRKHTKNRTSTPTYLWINATFRTFRLTDVLMYLMLTQRRVVQWWSHWITVLDWVLKCCWSSRVPCAVSGWERSHLGIRLFSPVCLVLTSGDCFRDGGLWRLLCLWKAKPQWKR